MDRQNYDSEDRASIAVSCGKNYRRIFKKTALEAENEYFKNKFDLKTNSIKILWNNLNTVCSIGKKKSKKSAINVLNINGNKLHCVSKKRPTFTTCCNFYMHSSIATVFGINVAEKAGNQNVLYFPTTPN